MGSGCGTGQGRVLGRSGTKRPDKYGTSPGGRTLGRGGEVMDERRSVRGSPLIWRNGLGYQKGGRVGVGNV